MYLSSTNGVTVIAGMIQITVFALLVGYVGAYPAGAGTQACNTATMAPHHSTFGTTEDNDGYSVQLSATEYTPGGEKGKYWLAEIPFISTCRPILVKILVITGAIASIVIIIVVYKKIPQLVALTGHSTEAYLYSKVYLHVWCNRQ